MVMLLFTCPMEQEGFLHLVMESGVQGRKHPTWAGATSRGLAFGSRGDPCSPGHGGLGHELLGTWV